MKEKQIELVMSMLVLVAAYIMGGYSARIFVTAKPKTPSCCIMIDAGHGGEDPGKVAADGIMEKNLNLEIAQKLKRLLEQQDMEIVMVRENDDALASDKGSDLKKRCEMIHNLNPKCVISIHQNSYPDSTVKGAQTFYYTHSEESKLLAQKVQEALRNGLDRDNHRKEKGTTDYYLLKKTKVPIIIVECGFLSNVQEAKLLQEDSYQEKIAWCIHMGVLRYLREIC